MLLHTAPFNRVSRDPTARGPPARWPVVPMRGVCGRLGARQRLDFRHRPCWARPLLIRKSALSHRATVKIQPEKLKIMQSALPNPDSAHHSVRRLEIFSRASSDASMRVNWIHDNDYLIPLWSKNREDYSHRPRPS